ncbi:uncharacterized protein [Ptychodera flava]|uniref:uncharacterized protein n=1 Tax=Ptychodera flava TaxID=63121 RepID=UPI00396A77AF
MSDAELKAALEDWLKKFQEFFVASDTEALAETLFTADSTMLAPGFEVQHKREGVARVLSEMKSAGVHNILFNIHDFGSSSGGELVFQRSSYTMVKADGSTIEVGKYLAVIKKIDGAYFYYSVCFNKDTK